MFKKFFNKSSSITSAAAVIAAAGLLSRLLGVLRDRVLASRFGAGDALDIYYAAFQFPDLIFNLLILGALSAGFIPLFVELLRDEEKLNFKDNRPAWNFVNNILNILGVCLIVSGALLALFAPFLVSKIAPGFSPEKLAATANLTRLMFLSPVLLGLSAVFGGILQSFKRFLVFSLAPVLYNLGIIIGALFFTDIWGVYGLAAGVILGAAMHLAVQIPAARNLGWRYKFVWLPTNNNFLRLLKMTGPRVLSMATNQLNLIVITILASTLTAGSLAIFNLANNLQSFPLGIFGISFAVAAFPTLSQYFAKKDFHEFNRIFIKTFKQIMFFIIPFSVALIILRIQVVRIILGSGKFDWSDTVLTANSLGIFAMSLFAQSLVPLLTRSFYAAKNTLVPFIISFASVAVNLILSLYLIRKIGVLGLAVGFSVAAIVNFVLSFVMLKIKIEEIGQQGIIRSLFKISVASLAMGVVIQQVKSWIGSFSDLNTFGEILMQGAFSAIAGAIVFLLVGYFLKIEELSILIASLRARLLKRVRVKDESIIEK
ncbi:murein biosynthesis integral membrane protein MurJ [Patescibacteria group bacterium]|nr:murein biosynthesis integral membrane protein MurJ [Patescibacteria group bacterium]